jgi:nucleotide-binding universal stress UspA family protein
MRELRVRGAHDVAAGAYGRWPVSSDLILIGYDGSPASERAVQEAGSLLGPRPALVVVVWESGTGFALVADPTLTPAPIDLRAALEIDRALYEGAQRLAHQGANRACDAGLEAEGLAVADELTVAETLLRIAKERDVAAIVIGSHGHNALREVLLGSTTRDVIKRATWPVIVVRGEDK